MCVDMRLCIPVYVGDICCLWYRLIDYKISVISSKIPGEKTIKFFFFPNRSILLTGHEIVYHLIRVHFTGFAVISHEQAVKKVIGKFFTVAANAVAFFPVFPTPEDSFGYSFRCLVLLYRWLVVSSVSYLKLVSAPFPVGFSPVWAVSLLWHFNFAFFKFLFNNSLFLISFFSTLKPNI